jgi:predicted RNase H-like nuclease (RuvC/YqgF family)
MKTVVNPDPHADGFKPQPTSSITAILDRIDDACAAVQALEQAGSSTEQISLFIGQEGLQKLDLHGERHGTLARVVRALETLTAEDWANRDTEAALNEGRIYLVVSTDGSDQQNANVESILKAHHAHTLRIVGTWAIQRLT